MNEQMLAINIKEHPVVTWRVYMREYQKKVVYRKWT